MSPRAVDVLRGSLVEALEAFAGRGRVLVALDFDGVLSPIVDVPSEARALPASAEALAALVATTDVALVSGRDITDLAACASPPPGVVLVGGHGTQSSLDGPGGGRRLSDDEQVLLVRLGEQLDEIAAAHPGTSVERKPMSVVLHTRAADRVVAVEATRAALAGPAALDGVHALRGKEVVEIGAVPLGKGAGLQRLREALSGAGEPVEAVLFAGDDVTDEDAFAVLAQDDGDLGVKVGSGDTRAAHRVSDPDEVALLLTHLVQLRAR